MSTQTEKLFRGVGAILDGHFLLTSGLHSGTYLEKFRVLQYPDLTQKLCNMIARHYSNSGIQLVAGPTTGGIIIAFEVARQLGVRSIFAEREGEARVFRRGFAIGKGEVVLVVDDILTTGGSVREVIAEVNRNEAKVAGVAVLVDRSEAEPDFGVPLFSCHRMPISAYEPAQCPLCRSGIPLVKPGSSSTKPKP
ncbi:MAG: orotate phosphoribosyltransferase [Dehalococcoidia bacterium]|nr:orotate phosphoribosyltransferase [Dehalococcoidia bacterium]